MGDEERERKKRIDSGESNKASKRLREGYRRLSGAIEKTRTVTEE